MTGQKGRMDVAEGGGRPSLDAGHPPGVQGRPGAAQAGDLGTAWVRSRAKKEPLRSALRGSWKSGGGVSNSELAVFGMARSSGAVGES